LLLPAADHEIERRRFGFDNSYSRVVMLLWIDIIIMDE
jgi:hypothetical protein